ncbi:MAG: hypothetical protein NZ954_07665 [Thermofilaceae archaeon]|nr:hypothetical protein [Thermofilaceae archaeon]MCX8179974.1 hypothetical protein [Thermofilaceae archaeon]MDW8004721.1 hypothetical protein [Thermofilaceae archaeon]
MPARVPAAKLRKAARMLLYRSGARPGVKGWELAKSLGGDYLDAVLALNSVLELLGLEVIAVDEKGQRLNMEGDLRKALFLVVLKENPTVEEAKTSGWRIDDLAVLSASLLYLLAKGGRAARNELLSVLKLKFKGPRLSYSLERLIRLGYLEEDGDQIQIGWRSRVEVDLDKLVGVSGLSFKP